MTTPKPLTPEELERIEERVSVEDTPVGNSYARRLIATVRAAWLERDNAELQAAEWQRTANEFEQQQLAERERCARIADDMLGGVPEADQDFGEGWDSACFEIARSIREG